MSVFVRDVDASNLKLVLDKLPDKLSKSGSLKFPKTLFINVTCSETEARKVFNQIFGSLGYCVTWIWITTTTNDETWTYTRIRAKFVEGMITNHTFVR